MKTPITLSLITTLLAPASFALPTFEGQDEKGRPCSMAAAEDGTVTFRTGTGYVFGGIPLKPEPSRLAFDSLTIQRSANFYSPPIGAPITFGNLGLVRIRGAIVLGASGLEPTHWVLNAVGGVANWWKRSFFCGRGKAE